MSINILEAAISDIVGCFWFLIPEIWNYETIAENRRLFLRDLLMEFREAKEEMEGYLTPQGLLELSTMNFDDLPMQLWIFIKLAYDEKNKTFTCDLIRERLERIGYPISY
jgi:hypothetical protein